MLAGRGTTGKGGELRSGHHPAPIEGGKAFVLEKNQQSDHPLNPSRENKFLVK
jgi:hypothetical protein